MYQLQLQIYYCLKDGRGFIMTKILYAYHIQTKYKVDALRVDLDTVNLRDLKKLQPYKLLSVSNSYMEIIISISIIYRFCYCEFVNLYTANHKNDSLL